MLPRISIFFILLLAFSQGLMAQDGKLAGKVLDEDGQPVGFVSILVFQGDAYRYGTSTAEDGTFSIQPVTPGSYRVEARYLGRNKTVTDVSVIANITRDLVISFEATTLEEVVIHDQGPFEKTPIVGTTLTSEDIINAGTRSINSLAAISAGVYQSDEGGALSVRGARSSATVYYVDGVKVRGSAS
ncbi:MAG: carboxypeptidase regulatory-like domain-containing protein, partial [Bacteroidota bacterium]